MRTVGERLKMLRIGCERGDFTGWVPMTHMIWDFEDLGSILYLGHGVSARAARDMEMKRILSRWPETDSRHFSA